MLNLTFKQGVVAALLVVCIWASGWYGRGGYDHEVPFSNPSFMKGYEQGEERLRLHLFFEKGVPRDLLWDVEPEQEQMKIQNLEARVI